MRSALAFALTSLMAGGCSPSGAVEDVDEGAIVRGTANETRFPAVGYLVRDGKASCTGSLVERDLVVTAAHCVVGVDQLAFGWGAVDANTTVGVTARVIEPRYKEPPPNGGLGFQSFDVALLQLERPAGIADTMARTTTPRSGRVLTIGYGSTRWEPNPEGGGFVASGAGTERKSAEGTIVAVNPAEAFVQFDDASTCYGDSGGPIIVDGKLFGVLSRFATQGRCRPEQRTPMGYARLDATPLFDHARQCFAAPDPQRCLMEDARGMCKRPTSSNRTAPRAMPLSFGDARDGAANVTLGEGSEQAFAFVTSDAGATRMEIHSSDDARMTIIDGDAVDANVTTVELAPSRRYVIVVRSCSGTSQPVTLVWRPGP